jgi:hypothetical protein
VRKDLFQASTTYVGSICGQSNDHFSGSSSCESRGKSQERQRRVRERAMTPQSVAIHNRQIPKARGSVYSPAQSDIYCQRFNLFNTAATHSAKPMGDLQ